MGGEVPRTAAGGEVSAEPVTSAKQLADELSDVVNRYMAHVEPTAKAQEYGIRLSMTGTLLNIELGRSPGRTPNISFTLQADPDDPPSEAARGFFGGR